MNYPDCDKCACPNHEKTHGCMCLNGCMLKREAEIAGARRRYAAKIQNLEDDRAALAELIRSVPPIDLLDALLADGWRRD